METILWNKQPKYAVTSMYAQICTFRVSLNMLKYFPRNIFEQIRLNTFRVFTEDERLSR